MLCNRIHEVKSYRSIAYLLGRFTFYPNEWLLTLDGESVPIGVRAIKILLVLVERPGEILPSNELTNLVWRGQEIHEGNLRVPVSLLRKILMGGFDGVTPIKTVPMRGYTFIGQVNCVKNELRAVDMPLADRDSVIRYARSVSQEPRRPNAANERMMESG